ncbi:MAG: hypothetical protein RBT50_03270 [Bacteroidales bacterium]|jgi:hypothetical protein|nr:hypothetical protein [Bacteroidales bacterium]
MKKSIIFLSALMLCIAVNAQWKAQTADTYEKTYRMAFVTSKSGGETLRIMRDITPGTAQKGTSPYDQISGQILLNKNVGTEYKVLTIVLRFDESTKMYIHQPADLKQGWDSGSGRYIIESDWKIWRTGDTRNKNAGRQAENAGAELKKEILDLMKSGKKINCQIVLLHRIHDTQNVINSEFTLQNSTKSINYLFL